jgi:hypothetical protein
MKRILIPAATAALIAAAVITGTGGAQTAAGAR